MFLLKDLPITNPKTEVKVIAVAIRVGGAIL
jgi:hypothetical protein